MREESAKLLFAIYVESNSVAPQIETLNYEMLDMEEQDFLSVVNSLYVSGLISGVSIKIGDDDRTSAVVSLKDALLTRRGAKFVEKQVKMSDALPRREKLLRLAKKVEALGWAKLGALAQKAIAEFNEK